MLRDFRGEHNKQVVLQPETKFQPKQMKLNVRNSARNSAQPVAVRPSFATPKRGSPLDSLQGATSHSFGNTTVKAAPAPGSECTLMVPPCARTMACAMLSPRPVFPCAAERALSPR